MGNEERRVENCRQEEEKDIDHKEECRQKEEEKEVEEERKQEEDEEMKELERPKRKVSLPHKFKDYIL